MPERSERHERYEEDGPRRLVIADYVQYIALAVGILLLVVLVRQLVGVLLIFLAAAILAYVLNPVVKRLEGRRVPRVVAVLGVFAVLGTVLGVAGLALVVPAVRQIQSLFSNPQILVDGATQLVDRARSIPYLGDQIGSLDRQSLMSRAQKAAPSGQTVSRALTGFVGGVFGTVFNLFLLAIISIYLLVDRERVTGAALWALPETVRDQTVQMLEVVEQRFVKFIKGQLLLCLLMGVIGWAIVQFTIGSYAIALGLWVGLMEFIPVIGAFLGAVPAVAVALLVSPVQALVVAALFLVAQQIEGNILVPKVIGDSVNVHPLWVLFGVMAASTLYGIVGALFALPAIAIISAALGYLRQTLLFEPWRKPPVSKAGTPAGRGDRGTPQTPPQARDGGPERPPETGSEPAPTFPGDRRGEIGGQSGRDRRE
ncbi:AI-2E family transporter [Rubrobacter aplysinae]|uniref:AI-2E family transporter n=1 Tax=Rubrobacter aplysinae TaxID=909625 RepID=UPI00064BACC7|nr:AI-2E family transporter [Rubrobacter aplysinae]